MNDTLYATATIVGETRIRFTLQSVSATLIGILEEAKRDPDWNGDAYDPNDIPVYMGIIEALNAGLPESQRTSMKPFLELIDSVFEAPKET